jgi:small subunit ribosomal protein S20
VPIIKSAIKKVRKDKKRTAVNSLYVKAYQATLKKIKKSLPAGRQGGSDAKKLVSLFYSQIDKAVKHKVIHKNKAMRLKSRVSLKLAKKK